MRKCMKKTLFCQYDLYFSEKYTIVHKCFTYKDSICVELVMWIDIFFYLIFVMDTFFIIFTIYGNTQIGTMTSHMNHVT